ncbi:5-formyltetrahydrofolate cyclo-ligase [Paucibacter sp. Y2R2-4]|uniref:5-formyltetrahydrofolate cyclo-ligase n=1 Tax=Paucibacter sp. Y2R2-4 TaxID=2893553 RepID=UPI00398CE76B
MSVDLNDRTALRHKLIEVRLNLPHRLELAEQLQEVLRVWLLRRTELTIGAYWPIKGEFDPLPALYRWGESHPERRIGLPVVDKDHGTLRFHVWYPGCPMEEDAYGIPKPKDTEVFEPQLLLVPCVGYGPFGLRLGYGGGFMDRTLAALQPRPATAGIGYAHGFQPLLKAEPHDVPLEAMLTEEGVVWDIHG